jgi:hypothetical protein
MSQTNNRLSSCKVAVAVGIFSAIFYVNKLPEPKPILLRLTAEKYLMRPRTKNKNFCSRLMKKAIQIIDDAKVEETNAEVKLVKFKKDWNNVKACLTNNFWNLKKEKKNYNKK